MNNVTPSPTEHLSTTTYLDFTGFNQKCFISRTMQVRGCYVPGRAESRNAQRRHAFATLRLTSNLEKEVLMPKVWLITGSSRGLGRALAEAVLAAGDKLVATARNPEQLADLVERYGDQVRTVALDVTNEQAASHAVAVATRAFGRLDVLANNAGYGDVSPIEDTSLDEFRAQIETNLFGVINVTKAALPLMREQGAGHILQFSSVGGRIGPVGRAPYAAAKWGVEGFSEVLSKEVGPLGVKVTIIEPGGFRTDFAGSSTAIREGRPEYDATVGKTAQFQRDYNGKQPGDPAKAAAAVLHIASLNDPPLRLLLGSDAIRFVEQNDLAKMESDRKWKDLSISTYIEQVTEQR
jgi:NAD(P)-dependent dehydrogenase (short-subunit alcohol dehydrogenase family)